MSVDQVLQAMNALAGSPDCSLQIYGDKQFRNTLTIGQIIKGKVLRHYEGSRYLVEFAGQERVVDSRFVLLEGSEIRGRVTSVDDKVVLQRVVNNQEPSSTESNEFSTQDSKLSELSRYLRSFNVELPVTQQNILTKLLRSSGDRQLTLFASLLLIKSGIKLSKESVALAESALKNGKLRLPNSLYNEGAGYFIENQSGVLSNGDAVQMLAEYLQKLLLSRWESHGCDTKKSSAKKTNLKNGDIEESLEDRENPSHELLDKYQGRDYFGANTWLMNGQVDGTVAHRIATLPLWVGGEIIEIDIAVFSQTEHKKNQPETKFQKIALSLETNNIGKVNVIADIVDSHLKLSIQGEGEEKAALLSEYNGELQKCLAATVWVLDKVSYEGISDSGCIPAAIVAEHVIKQDSLSRLV